METLTIRSAQARRNLLEWSQRVADCRSSGQSVTRWCAEHNIKPKTYYNWQKKVFSAMIDEQEAGPKFVELPAPVLQNSLAATVRIGDATLEVYKGADAEMAAALCKVLSDAK